MKTTDKLAALTSCAVFRGASFNELSLLAEMMGVEKVRAGEILLQAGDFSDRIYVVVEGCLSVFLPNSQTPARQIRPGELIGEYGMFSDRVRTATVKADMESFLLSLDYIRFRVFLLQYPEATLALLKSAVERLLRAESRNSAIPH